jgi:DNA-binding PadR family transcriptional regulator
MLKLAILGLLKERPMHGYELKKQLGQRLGFFWTVSFGSLYPTLKKLERRGVVAKVATEQTSRRKQAYRITEMGEQEFLTLLEEGAATTWEEEKFPLRLAFFRYLRPEIRIRLLERRRAYLEERLDEGADYLSHATRGQADSYTLSLMRHGMSATRHDIAWLDELITAERAALAEERSDESAHDSSPTAPRGQADGEDDEPPRPSTVGPTTPDAHGVHGVHGVPGAQGAPGVRGVMGR